MPVIYQELEGSPKITMNREGGSATRVVLINWGDINNFILEVFPKGNFGFPLTASFPGYRWLRAQSIDIEPWFAEAPRGYGEPVNVYVSGARVTVNYAPNKIDDVEEQTFVEQEISSSAEFLTWPNQGVRWQTTPSGEVVACGQYVGKPGTISTSDIDKRKSTLLSEEIKVGIVIPIIERTMTWHYVTNPPWVNIRNCLGKLNDRTWQGAPKETVLFGGFSASRQTTSLGIKAWKLTYKFQEKCLNYPVPKPYKKLKDGQMVTVTPEPEGWNHFLRPMGLKSRFDRVIYEQVDENEKYVCKSPYQLADFRKLFRGR